MSFGGEIKGLGLGMSDLRCLMRHPRGDSKWQLETKSGVQG